MNETSQKGRMSRRKAGYSPIPSNGIHADRYDKWRARA